MVTGLVVDGAAFEVLLAGGRVGSGRVLAAEDVSLLSGLGSRYARAVSSGADQGVLIALGRELSAWLEGDQGQLSGLLERAARPMVFEVRGPVDPSPAAWAVLRAPWELLALPGGGFLGEDELTRFCVVRRLGVPGAGGSAGGLDGFRLGLAFMASSPRGAEELDFEAEEAAVLDAVGATRLDLVVDDTGDPVQLGHRLADLGGLPVVHLSCHGHNSWPVAGGGRSEPVLLMEDETGGPRPTTAGGLVGALTPLPRVVFVSACLTATGADVGGHPPSGGGLGSHREVQGGMGGGASDALPAHSLATALVAAGVPAVVGWDGSVEDGAATRFAGVLYARLADRVDLAVAVGDARRRLLESADESVRRDWHLARLWLGPAGGGRRKAAAVDGRGAGGEAVPGYEAEGPGGHR